MSSELKVRVNLTAQSLYQAFIMIFHKWRTCEILSVCFRAHSNRGRGQNVEISQVVLFRATRRAKLIHSRINALANPGGERANPSELLVLTTFND